MASDECLHDWRAGSPSHFFCSKCNEALNLGQLIHEHRAMQKELAMSEPAQQRITFPFEGVFEHLGSPDDDHKSEDVVLRFRVPREQYIRSRALGSYMLTTVRFWVSP